MTAGEHDAGGGFGRSAGTNVVRGVMVIAAAVIVGLILMVQGLSNDSAESSTTTTVSVPTDGAGDTVPPETPTTAPVVETTTTLAAPRDPSQVKVLVINGTDPLVSGLAGAGTDLLKPFNYVTLQPKNADVAGASAVFYVEGFQSEANAVAVALGVDPAAVVQPLDPAASPIADTQGADIIVRIGSDGVIKA
jgi:hypothetical protein